MKKSLAAIGVMFILGYTMSVYAQSDYYEFSTFAGAGSEFDVACYGNDIYYGSGTNVYVTTVSVADPTKVNAPKNYDDDNNPATPEVPNPDYQIRSFTTPTHITLGSPVNAGSRGEMYIDENYIYTGYNQTVKCFDKITGAYVSTVVTGAGMTDGYNLTAFLSYGDGKWWSGDESRRIYSSTGGAWEYEFTFNNMAGGHGDGMEFVNGHVFVSDMTSNFLAQWDEVDGVWSETERFAYTEAGGVNKYVEGMGYGALGHFWAGSGSYIYELGGGEIQEVIDPTGVPEPATISLLGLSLLGFLGFGSIRRRKK